LLDSGKPRALPERRLTAATYAQTRLLPIRRANSIMRRMSKLRDRLLQLQNRFHRHACYTVHVQQLSM